MNPHVDASDWLIAKDDMWLQEMMLGCDTELFETVRKAVKLSAVTIGTGV